VAIPLWNTFIPQRRLWKFSPSHLQEICIRRRLRVWDLMDHEHRSFFVSSLSITIVLPCSLITVILCRLYSFSLSQAVRSAFNKASHIHFFSLYTWAWIVRGSVGLLRYGRPGKDIMRDVVILLFFTSAYTWLDADVCILYHGFCDCDWVYLYCSCFA